MLVLTETRLSSFPFWGGAKETAAKLTEDEFKIIEDYFEEAYPNGCPDTTINDTFFFNGEWVLSLVGKDYEEDEDEEPEEPFYTSLNPWDAPGMKVSDFI